MAPLLEYLTFRRMIAPAVTQILLWAGIAGCLYGAWVLYKLGNWTWPFPLLLGPLIVRLFFERLIIAFRSYDALRAIERNLERGTD
ncbi:hypothetical protein [Sphingomicrobium nitratireducens]|uniref:hypothetical protein n=1 Tax=Sphingomicrobium nitratireducens TaxID=2964666 RepID=UPI002240E0CB|nr:hypothetical protein [Sphingomicrobium nitratireducens]